MEPEGEPIRVGRVVRRLRVSLGLIFGLITALLLGLLLEFRDLRQAHAELIEIDMPVLENVQALNRELALFIGRTFESVASLPPGEKPAAQASNSQRLAAVSDEVARIVTFNAVEGPQEDFRLEIARLDRLLHRTLELRSQIWRLETRLSDLRTDFAGVGTDIRTRIEQMMIAAALDFQISVDSVETTAATASDDLRQEVERALRLTAIGLQIDSYIATTEQFASAGSHLNAAEVSARLRFNLRGVSQALVQAPAGDLRSEVAQLLSGLDRLALGEDGIVETGAELGLVRLRLAEVAAEKREVAEQISDRAASFVSTATAAVAETSVKLDRTIDKTSLLALIVCAAVLLIVGVLSIVVVERQINRRISRLTDAARDIAGGDIQRRVNVHGQDELGDIAAALEVFKALAGELTRSNADLQKFAYVASHDLRSPLKAIHDLASWTLEDADELSEEHRENLTLLCARVNRLSALLRDLLEYARAGEETAALGLVDLETEVCQIAELLDPADAFNISLDCEDEIVETHAVALRQILHNLTSNAIKHHDRPRGRITVTARRIRDRLHLAVSDDGPGIEVRYQKRIFELFQTLRSRDEVEGSGLGLAIVAKLVDRFGGAIRVVSDPSLTRGATFEFDLPCRIADAEARIAA